MSTANKPSWAAIPAMRCREDGSTPWLLVLDGVAVGVLTSQHAEGHAKFLADAANNMEWFQSTADLREGRHARPK